jgi:hypothetical protein
MAEKLHRLDRSVGSSFLVAIFTLLILIKPRFSNALAAAKMRCNSAPSGAYPHCRRLGSAPHGSDLDLSKTAG